MISFVYNEIINDDKFHKDNIKSVKQTMFVLGIVFASLITSLVMDFLEYLHK